MADVHLRQGEDGPTALPTLFDEVGGQPFFDELCTRFYDRVQRDEVLWPMYPADDLDGAIRRLALFLGQFFGGPATYSAERGHPRLRMRHFPFHVNPEAREHWLSHMTAAVEEMGPAPIHREAMLDYFDRASTAMVNTFEPTPPVGERGPKAPTDLGRLS
ncbi:Group 2 truncated hemoglobin GlbO [Pseudoclavibacter triregionum]|nr:Group 2 truncated hemoglobin GlbO [Pseudoclavibacter triregionum]